MTRYCLEVCQGPDCLGSGGGAVLLEVEELAQEYHEHSNTNTTTTTRPTIEIGACRNACTMGPNVYLDGRHFTKVTGPAECAALFAASHHNSGGSATTDTAVPSMTTKMMLRKADRQRWQCLRQMARLKASRKATDISQLRNDLSASFVLEHNAVRNHELLLQRAARRKERLERRLEEIIGAINSNNQQDAGCPWQHEASYGSYRMQGGTTALLMEI